jgi:hypothetical protein
MQVLKKIILVAIGVAVGAIFWLNPWTQQLVINPVNALDKTIRIDSELKDFQGRLENRKSFLDCARDPACVNKEDRLVFSPEAEIKNLCKEIEELEDKIQQLKREKTSLLAKKSP